MLSTFVRLLFVMILFGVDLASCGQTSSPNTNGKVYTEGVYVNDEPGNEWHIRYEIESKDFRTGCYKEGESFAFDLEYELTSMNDDLPEPMDF